MSSIEDIKTGGGKKFSRAASVAWVLVSLLLGLLLARYILNDGAVFSGDPVRNCIVSVLGKLPDCNDGRGGDGAPKATTVNGKSIGVCRSVSAEGVCIP